jgi:outer membrane protein W
MIAKPIVHGIVLTLLVLAGYRPAVAQLPIEVEAGSFVGGALFLSNNSSSFTISRQEASPLVVKGGEVRNAIAMGVTAGLVFGERVGVEGMYAWVPGLLHAREGLEAQGGSVDINSIRYGATLRYEFAPERRIQPFVGLGVGAETITYGNHLAWARRTRTAPFATLGSSFWLEDGVSVRLQATRDLGSAGEVPSSQLMLTVGLNVRQRVR